MSPRSNINPKTPIVDPVTGWPTQAFLDNYEQLPASASAMLDAIADSVGSILVRGTAKWAGLASPNDTTKFLNGAASPTWSQVKDSDLSLSDVTANDVSTTAHGFAPKAPNDATKYLNGVGGWSVPAGGGGGGGGSVHYALPVYGRTTHTNSSNATLSAPFFCKAGSVIDGVAFVPRASATKNVRAGLYADSGGANNFPTTLLASTTTAVAVETAGQILEVAFDSSYTVPADGIYWAALYADSGIDFSSDVGYEVFINNPSPQLPNPFGTPSVTQTNTNPLLSPYGDIVLGGSPLAFDSVGLTMPAEFSVADSPLTASGTLAVTKATQAANKVWAGPTSGADAVPTFRLLTAADLPTGATTVSLFHNLPAGAGVNSIYRTDTTKTSWPYTTTVSSVSGTTLTIGSSVAQAAFEPTFMKGLVYARIWNTTKNQSAWISDAPSTTTFTVTSAGDISGWSSGDALRIADIDAGGTPRAIALDISQMMTAQFGRIFRQDAIIIGATLRTTTANADAAFGVWSQLVSGGQVGLSGISTSATGSEGFGGVIYSACKDLSPLSNSNLVYIADSTLSGTSISLANCIALVENVTAL